MGVKFRAPMANLSRITSAKLSFHRITKIAYLTLARLATAFDETVQSPYL
jgi:hypothetical protein